MKSFIDRLKSASREELEAPATRAVQEAIARIHRAGRPAFGNAPDGGLVRVHPDGRVEVLKKANGTDSDT
jgi:hypothetical protein